MQFSRIQRSLSTPHIYRIYPTEEMGKGWVTNHSRFTDSKVVYRRYASLFFIAGIDSGDNELITLEIVHRYVEQMDKYYGNVCELDIIFNFQKAYFILDELLIAGELQESSKKNVLRCISQEDALEDMEVSHKLPLILIISPSTFSFSNPYSFSLAVAGCPLHFCSFLVFDEFYRV